MNRRQLSPPRLRPKKIDIDVHRIINHAAKLVMEYNQNKVNHIMQSDIDNREKVNELLRLSSAHLPKLINRAKGKKKRKGRDHRTNSLKVLSTSEENIDASENKKNNSIKSVYSSLFEDSQEIKILSVHSTNVDSVEESEESEEGRLIDHNLDKKDHSTKSSLKSYQSDDLNIVSNASNQLDRSRSTDTAIAIRSESSIKLVPLGNTENKPDDLKTENIFRYVIGIKTGGEEKTKMDSDMFIIITGEDSKTSTKQWLRNHNNPEIQSIELLNQEGFDNFELNLSYHLGTLKSVVVGLDTGNAPVNAPDSSLYLESISIRDCSSDREYHFQGCKKFKNDETDNFIELELHNPPNNEEKNVVFDVEVDHSFNTKENYENEEALYFPIDENEEESIQKSEMEVESSKYSLGEDADLQLEVSRSESSQIPDSDKIQSSVISEKVTPIDPRSNIYNKEENGEYESAMVRNNPEESNYQKTSSSNSDFQVGESYKNNSLVTTLYAAIEAQDLQAIKELCSSKLMHIEDDKGLTPMHVAAICYEDNDVSKEIIQHLLSRNFDPHSKSRMGYSPLHSAIISGNLQSVKYLKEVVRVNYNQLDDEGHTPLRLAILNGKDIIAEYLEGRRSSQEENFVVPTKVIKQRNDSRFIGECERNVYAEDQTPNLLALTEGNINEQIDTKDKIERYPVNGIVQEPFYESTGPNYDSLPEDQTLQKVALKDERYLEENVYKQNDKNDNPKPYIDDVIVQEPKYAGAGRNYDDQLVDISEDQISQRVTSNNKGVFEENINEHINTKDISASFPNNSVIEGPTKEGSERNKDEPQSDPHHNDDLLETANETENKVMENKNSKKGIANSYQEVINNTRVENKEVDKAPLQNTTKKDKGNRNDPGSTSTNDDDEDDDNRGIRFSKKINIKTRKSRTSNASNTSANTKNLRFTDESSLDSKISDNETSDVSSRSSSPLTHSVESSSYQSDKIANQQWNSVESAAVEERHASVNQDSNGKAAHPEMLESDVTVPIGENYVTPDEGDENMKKPIIMKPPKLKLSRRESERLMKVLVLNTIFEK